LHASRLVSTVLSLALVARLQSLVTPQLIIIINILIFVVIVPAFFQLRKFAKKKRVSMSAAVLLIVMGAPEDEHVIETATERRDKKRRRSWISRYKIFSSTYQVIASSTSTFQVNMGPIFTGFVNTMKVVNFDFVSFIPVQCYVAFDYIGSMETTALGPFIVVAVLLTFAALEIFYLQSERDRMRRRYKLSLLMKKYFGLSIIIMSTVLPSVSFKLFKIFDCFDVDPFSQAGDGVPHRYLRVDSAVDCSSDKYTAGVSASLFFIVCYPIMVPLTFFYLIHTSKHEIIARGIRARQMALVDKIDEGEDMSKAEKALRKRQARVLRDRFEKMSKASSGVVDSLTFLFEAYRPEFYYWELIEIFRKLSATSILGLIEPGTPMQITFGVLLSAIYIKVRPPASRTLLSSD